MGFWSLFEVASMPVLQVLIICVMGAFMATGRCNLLPADTRKALNKIVFIAFTPSLIFASLTKTVTLQDIISWWFMPINIGISFLVGEVLGWILVKVLKPMSHLEGLIIAACSTGNLGNLPLIVIPAVCDDWNTCHSAGLSYASFLMALGGFYIWTYTYQLIRTSSMKYKAIRAAKEASKAPNIDPKSGSETHLLKEKDGEQQAIVSVQWTKASGDAETQAISHGDSDKTNTSLWNKVREPLHQVLEELMSPPTLAAIVGFIVGAITFLKNLIIGENAPLHVIQDTIQLLGDGTIPCITLILGGNLTQRLRSSRIRPWAIARVICVWYVILPVIGIGVVKAASKLGLLASDPLYHYVLMVQFSLPPAMNIGTMTQLFDVGQEECSVLFLWTYLFAAIALTLWSTAYMWILS
ncbi:protein PIN-LIKES 5-like [Syzygium oleosum]|uniref:protein PIN-LIKES 5-like n=1 Tax=Syzygium oleosum TaxID=219896 RepID=UPI0024BB73CE|nr:protein PIN-LIKES 5-like [Syzygium oleosum]